MPVLFRTTPAIVPSSVLGRDDKAAPSERITVGFIGCGKMANDHHLHELLRFGDVQALAVCEVDRTSRGHHRNWLDCIRSRNRPLADVEIGARSVAITILGNLAYWNGRHLRWDPAKWEFVDDPEANRWLDRERRDLWQLPAV